MSETKLPYRPHIDGLRAVAVLSVIVFHAFPAALPAGFVGVDIFFVISGFLISGILFADFGSPCSKGLEVIGKFYCRRIRRIFPSLVVVLTAAYGIGYATLLPGELAKLGLAGLAAAGFCLNLFLAQTTGYFDSDASSQPLLHLWSLGVEEQFYLVWPLIIWIAIRVRASLLSVTLFLGTFSFVWAVTKPHAIAAAAFYLPQHRLWELLVGSLAALAVPILRSGARRSSWTENLMAVFGWALLGAGFILIRSASDVPNAWILLPTMGAALVVASDGTPWIHRWILSSPLLVSIGLISYPLYLWHWVLLTFGRLATAHGDSPRTKLLAVAASIVLAWLTYVLVEKPLRGLHAAKVKIALLVAAMSATAALGLLIDRADGYPARFPPLIQALSRFKYDPFTAWRNGSYFLHADTPGAKFVEDPHEIDPRRPSLVLWGDSYAAALYPGLKVVYGQKFSIVQRTIAGTPPFVGSPSRSSLAQQHLNQQTIDTIQRIRPQVVMLEARWAEEGWKFVEATIARIKSAGVTHIILVGPMPEWEGTLPQQVCNYVRQHRSEGIPVRLAAGTLPDALLVDASMRAMSARLGVQYVSPCDILHDRNGYLVRVGDTPESFIQWDYGHLTTDGSVYLVSHFPTIE